MCVQRQFKQSKKKMENLSEQNKEEKKQLFSKFGKYY